MDVGSDWSWRFESGICPWLLGTTLEGHSQGIVTTRLSVNVNKIAWLRNAREGTRPDLLHCCQVIVNAGAHGITVHPRSDQRHIRPADVYAIHELISQTSIEYNIEGNPSVGALSNGYPGFIDLVENTCPTQCTLVPDSPTQSTSDHGWELNEELHYESVRTYIRRIHGIGPRVSLFLEPSIDMVKRARDCGADRIELYTGPWCELVTQHGIDSGFSKHSLEKFQEAAEFARSIGLKVNAGHDLDLNNVGRFCSEVNVDEVSIGHALVSDALDYGLKDTVERYLSAISNKL